MSESSAPRGAIREPVRRMHAYVPGEQPEDGPYIKLNQNENPYPPSPGVAQAVSEAVKALPLYPEPTNRIVREAAASCFGVTPEEVMATNSSDEMLRILCQACASEGERIVTFYPGFSFYHTLADVQGARFEEIDLTEDFALPALPPLDDAKLVFLPNPNAPTGTLFPEEEIRRLLEAAPRALVVIDEAYGDFAGVSAVPLLREYPHLVVVRTLSKSYSLAGLRVGLGFARREVMTELDKVRDFYNVDALAQPAAAAAILDAAHLRHNVERINATRHRLAEGLARRGVHAWPSAANFVLARFVSPSAVEVLAALRERRILVRHFPRRRLEDCLRITVGTDEEIDSLLGALDEIL